MTALRQRRARTAFSIIELAIVSAILAVLACLLAAAVHRVRLRAERMSCGNNMRQVGLGVLAFEAEHGRVPSEDRLGLAYLQWRAFILPHIDQGELWARTRRAAQSEIRSYLHPPHVGAVTVVNTFLCKADGRLGELHEAPNGVAAAFGSYLGVAGANGHFGMFPGGPRRVRLSQVADGLSHTLLLGERPPPSSFQAGWWYSNVVDDSYGDHRLVGPNNSLSLTDSRENRGEPGLSGYRPGRLEDAEDRFHFWSLHPGGANFCLSDGSVRFLGYDVGPKLLAASATRDQGETGELP